MAPAEPRPPKGAIAIGELLGRNELALTLVAGEPGLARTTTGPKIQKPRLALTRRNEQLHAQRVLVFGATEIDYLVATPSGIDAGLATVMASDPACVVICRGLAPPAQLVALCETAQVPLFVSTLGSADFITNITAWMGDRLAPTTEVHGVLVDVLGIGVLVTGKSGIGKSETALDLVVRGHRLVADDVVRIRRRGTSLSGRGAGILGHHMEIRGLGIINIKDLFGIAAVRETKKIELVVELHEWAAGVEYERLGFDDRFDQILGVSVPTVRLPVRPGRNLATLIEVAARNQLLKVQGIHSAQAFRDKLQRAMQLGNDPDAE